MRIEAAVILQLAFLGLAGFGEERPLLDLKTAEQMALARDPRIQAQQEAVRVARMERGEAIELKNPELRSSYTKNSSPADPLEPLDVEDSWDEQSVALRLYTPHVWSIGPLRDAGEARIHEAEAGVRTVERQLITEVRTAFAEIQYLDESIALYDPLVSVLETARQTARARQEGSEATPVESVTADLDYLEAISERDELKQALESKRGWLAALIGAGDLSSWNLMTRVDLPSVDPYELDVTRLVEAACERRSELDVLSWEWVALKAELRAERSHSLPSLVHVEGAIKQESGDQEDEAWSVQAAVEIPVFSLLDRRRENVLAARMAGLEAQLVATRDRVAREVKEALGNLKTASDNWKRFDRDAGPLVREMRKVLKATEGEAGIGLGLQAELKKKTIKAAKLWLRSRNAYIQAVLKLEEVIGGDLSEMAAAGG